VKTKKGISSISVKAAAVEMAKNGGEAAIIEA
jgi:hypothetical protein